MVVEGPRSLGRRRRKAHELKGIALARQGRIPWTVDEYMTVLAERRRLEQTPHDDWDRREYGLVLTNQETGEATRIVFNPDKVENQIAHFVRERYNAEARYLIMAHLLRYFTMNDFLRRNQGRLIEEGLIRPDPDSEEGRVEVSEAILFELATAPYEQLSVDADGAESWAYDREKVIERAKMRHNEEEVM